MSDSSRARSKMISRPSARDVEVADRKRATEIRQLALLAGLEIEDPELLVRDVSFQDDQRILPPRKTRRRAPRVRINFGRSWGVPSALTAFTGNVVPTSAPE